MVQLAGPGERPAARPGGGAAQMVLGRVRVVARLDGDVEDLLEGVAAGLAGLELDEVERLVARCR